MSTQRATASDSRAVLTAPSLSEFFDEVPAADTAPASADYDFFGDSRFTPAHD
ncbi:MAG: hypothetical protein HYV96_16545 [Opitutae bacterium]|nr:hypothetical protein [Opitutae bacterium]